jgi:hypothetical protein
VTGPWPAVVLREIRGLDLLRRHESPAGVFCGVAPEGVPKDDYELERYWDRLRGRGPRKAKPAKSAPDPHLSSAQLGMADYLVPYWPELPFPEIQAGWWVWVQLCRMGGPPRYVGDRLRAPVAPTNDWPRVSLRVVFPPAIPVGIEVNSVAVWEQDGTPDPTTIVMLLPRLIQPYESVPVEISFVFQRLLAHAGVNLGA